MRKITNKQLNQLSKLVALEVARVFAKVQTLCPKTMSGRHYFVKGSNFYVGTEKRCKYCGMRKNK